MGSYHAPLPVPRSTLVSRKGLASTVISRVVEDLSIAVDFAPRLAAPVRRVAAAIRDDLLEAARC